jgi:hypothetical protein
MTQKSVLILYVINVRAEMHKKFEKCFAIKMGRNIENWGPLQEK